MKTANKTRTEQILQIMLVLAWIAFIGLMIEAGAVIFSYGLSCINPDAAKNLYKRLDLYSLRQLSFHNYTLAVSFMIALSCMKAYISYLVIKVLTKVNLDNPFTTDVARKLETISYILLETWIVSVLYNAYSHWLLKRTGELAGGNVQGEFLFAAGLVFIIAQIFKRGVEIQAENELTI
ncbi:MAG TPA: DUF2975 domain-containing protein [Ohtaekwangia sp.]|uniref:DUF2975 domain-containing protein n=1 Tax=Ohtaekwangia sp. TaxID=2066019 RepID=UPI002F930E6D